MPGARWRAEGGLRPPFPLPSEGRTAPPSGSPPHSATAARWGPAPRRWRSVPRAAGLLLLLLLLLSPPPPECRSLARRPSSGYSSSSRAASSPSAGASSPSCSTWVLRGVQILECLSQPSGVYFGDEGCGGPVLEAADGQRKCLKRVHSRGCDGHLHQLARSACSRHRLYIPQSGVYMDLTYLHYSVIK